MTKISHNVWDYLDFPNSEERKCMDGSTKIAELRLTIDELGFSGSEDTFILDEPSLYELLVNYNNKVFDMVISYEMMVHFHNKGVSEMPWGSKEAEEKDRIFELANRYWFGYYSDFFLIQSQTLWDIVIKMINCYFEYFIDDDLRLLNKLIAKLKLDHPLVHKYLTENIKGADIYKKVHKYRINSTHKATNINPKDTVTIVKSNGGYIELEHGSGDFEKPSELLNNINTYLDFIRKAIHELFSVVIRG